MLRDTSDYFLLGYVRNRRKLGAETSKVCVAEIEDWNQDEEIVRIVECEKIRREARAVVERKESGGKTWGEFPICSCASWPAVGGLESEVKCSVKKFSTTNLTLFYLIFFLAIF